MQCHVLGVALLPIVGALLVADARSRPPARSAGGSCASGSRGWRSSSLSYLPLVVHELTTDFSEVARRARLPPVGRRPDGARARSSGSWSSALRVVTWPLTGLITDAALAGAARDRSS